MTDRDIMRQALEALTAYDGTNGASQRKRVLAALRDRLAHCDRCGKKLGDVHTCTPRGIEVSVVYHEGMKMFAVPVQQEHHDPIGDAQDKLIAEQAKKQPQMQPCAGRNCGSTNPNLHSAECFEDYEKSTGMAQPVSPKCGAIIEVFGKEWRLEYMSLPVGKHKLYPQQYTYTTPSQRTWVGLTDEEITDIWAEASPYYHEDDFARAIEAKLRSKNT